MFIIYYSSYSPSSLITESLSVTQSLSSLSSPSSSHRMSSSDPSKALLMQHFLKDLTIMFTGMAFRAADTHRATSEGAARKGRLKERCGLEPRTNFFSFKKSADTSADYIRELTVILYSWSSIILKKQTVNSVGWSRRST